LHGLNASLVVAPQTAACGEVLYLAAHRLVAGVETQQR